MNNPQHDSFLKIFQMDAEDKMWSWRHFIAELRIITKQSDEQYKEFGDNYLDHIIAFLEARRKNFTVKNINMEPFKIIKQADKIWNDRSKSKIQFELDAFIIAGADDDELLELFPQELGLGVFENYRKIFFDIEDYRDKTDHMEQNILKFSRIGSEEILWKFLAMRVDPSELKRFYAMPKKKFKEDELVKEIEEYIATLGK